MSAHADRTQRGLTLVEVLITAAILVTLSIIVSNLMVSGTDAQKYSERVARATEIAQDLVDEMRRELSSSVLLMHNDATGTAYRSLLKFPPEAQGIAGLLPALRSAGIFEPEPTPGAYTGNELVFARHSWTDRYITLTGAQVYSIDVYRVTAYYLKAEDGGPRAGSAAGLNLCKFTSEPLADGNQIDSIKDDLHRAEIIELLSNGRTTFDAASQPDPVHSPVAVVWRLGDDPADVGTLRQITPGSWTLSDAPLPPRDPSWEILRDDALSSDGMLRFRHYSVASNFAPSAYGVAKFGVKSAAGDGFPHGFEVQVIGPASARQVLLRLSVVSTNNKGQHAFQELQVIQDARDI